MTLRLIFIQHLSFQLKERSSCNNAPQWTTLFVTQARAVGAMLILIRVGLFVFCLYQGVTLARALNSLFRWNIGSEDLKRLQCKTSDQNCSEKLKLCKNVKAIPISKTETNF